MKGMIHYTDSSGFPLKTDLATLLKTDILNTSRNVKLV